MQIDLSGKTALVTGCRRGLGRAIAEELAEAGADIVGLSRQLDPADEVAVAVRGLGRRFYGYQVDLADRSATQQFLSAMEASGPEVDILVNNAGVVVRTATETLEAASWDEQLEINLSSQFLLSQHFGRLMAARGGGKIVSIVSVISFQGGQNIPGYAATKTAMVGLTRSLCNEFAGRGVNVNAVAPGYFETDMTSAIQDDPERREAIRQRIPAGRWGRPQDLVGAVTFLSSDASDYINGVVIPVDGGWLAS